MPLFTLKSHPWSLPEMSQGPIQKTAGSPWHPLRRRQRWCSVSQRGESAGEWTWPGACRHKYAAISCPQPHPPRHTAMHPPSCLICPQSFLGKSPTHTLEHTHHPNTTLIPIFSPQTCWACTPLVKKFDHVSIWITLFVSYVHILLPLYVQPINSKASIIIWLKNENHFLPLLRLPNLANLHRMPNSIWI